MQGNAIVNFFRLIGLAFLVFMVWLTWLNSKRMDERQIQLNDRYGAVSGELQTLNQANRKARDEARSAQEQVANLAGQVEALKDVLSRGGFRSAGPVAGAGLGEGAGSGDGAGADPSGGESTPPPRRTGMTGAPRHLGPKSRALWGQHPNYLSEDPNPIESPAVDDARVDPDGRMVAYYGSQASKIIPLVSNDSNVTTRIEQYCLLSLAERHHRDASKWAPVLAERVQVNKPDHTEWTVFLRDDMYWHPARVDYATYPHLQGRHKITAHDIKFYIDMVLNPDVECEHARGYFSECAGCDVIDDHCCVIRWNKPQYNSIETTLSVQPIPKFVLAYDEAGEAYAPDQVGLALNKHWFYRDNKYVGSGPYLVAEYDPSTYLLLRRNESYFGDLPALKEMYFKVYDKGSLSETLIESGELDLAGIRAIKWDQEVNKAKDPSPFNDGTLDTAWVWSTGFAFIGWKQTHPIFQDKMVRRAMTHACNRPRFVNSLLVGRGAVITGTQHINSPFTPKDIKPWPFDLEEAKRLLTEAGWADTDGDGLLDKVVDGVKRPFEFTATVPSGSTTVGSMFEIYKEDLSKIGIKMSVDSLQWKIFVEKMQARDFECITLSWNGNGYEGDLYQIWHTKSADEVPSSNFIEYRNPELDALIIELRTVFEFDERLPLHRAQQAILHEDQPYTFLFTGQSPVMWWKDRLGNVKDAVEFASRPAVRYSPMYRRAAR